MQTRSRAPSDELEQRRQAMPRLGIGFIGSGFNARFHMQAFRGVRDADVLGVWSPNAKNAADGAPSSRGARRRRRRKPYRVDRRDGRRSRHRRDLAVRAQSRAHRERRGDRRRDRARAGRRSRASPARSRWRATSPRRSGCCELVKRVRARARLPREPGLRAAGRARTRADLGARRARPPAVRISRARPRSTAVRTCRGSGRASCRAAACSTT